MAKEREGLEEEEEEKREEADMRRWRRKRGGRERREEGEVQTCWGPRTLAQVRCPDMIRNTGLATGLSVPGYGLSLTADSVL